jgi:hypothetical protein
VANRANIQDWIAESRIEIEMARLLTLKAAYLMDTVGNQKARVDIAAIKIAAPQMALKVIDGAIQVHGGGGVSNDFRSPSSTPTSAHSGWLTAPTRCTSAPSRCSSCVVAIPTGRRRRSEHDPYDVRARRHRTRPLARHSW